jgi:hypothetical protein
MNKSCKQGTRVSLRETNGAPGTSTVNKIKVHHKYVTFHAFIVFLLLNGTASEDRGQLNSDALLAIQCRLVLDSELYQTCAW